MAYLVLIRHGRSLWNDKGLWTGWTDIGLNKEGKDEAKATAQSLLDLSFDIAHTSKLKRAKQTLDIIFAYLKITNLEIIKHQALNERHYGDYTGKNKWQVKEEIGEEKFQLLRRSWDYPIPNGESLKQVFKRVFPYYKKAILPHLKKGKNVIISAHGNSLRALVKHLEEIPDEEISQLEIKTGEAYVYEIDAKGKIVSKQIRAQNSKAV